MAEHSKAALPWNYRTIPCSFYEKGLCKHGDNCHFIHDDAPGAPRAPKQMCRFYEKGACKLGDKCIFSHDDEDANESKTVKELNTTSTDFPRNYRTLPCKFFSLGRCAKGSACTFIHEVEGFEEPSRDTPAAVAVETKQLEGIDTPVCMYDRATDIPTTSDESEDNESEESASGSAATGQIAKLQEGTAQGAARTPHPRREEYGPPPDWPAPPPPADSATPPPTPPLRHGPPPDHPPPGLCSGPEERPSPEVSEEDSAVLKPPSPQKVSSIRSAIGALPPWRRTPKAPAPTQDETDTKDTVAKVGEVHQKPFHPWRTPEDRKDPEESSQRSSTDEVSSSVKPDTQAEVSTDRNKTPEATLVRVHVLTGNFKWRTEIWDLETIENELNEIATESKRLKGEF